METMAEHLESLHKDLQNCRMAIFNRGGTITARAGFAEVAKSIVALPPNNVVGTVIDDSIALEKSVPANSTKSCYLNSIGGATYKDDEANVLIDTKVTAVRSYKADGSLIAEYPLPQSLIDAQTGKGIGAYADTIDLENGKVVHKTKTMKLADVAGWNSLRYNSPLDGNAYISDGGLAGFKSYSVNDFLLSKTNAFLCNVLPPTTDWQGTTMGVNLQKMSNGNHYINLAVPIKALGITSSATAREIGDATIAWLNANDATLTYALEVPTEGALDTDFFPLIEVEGGGRIEFITDSGEAAPSTITFQTINS